MQSFTVITKFFIMLQILFIIAYLIGSVSCAIYVSRFMGLPDPRNHGSQNPGATNILRTGKKSAALFVLIGDVLKGAISVFFAKFCGLEGSALGWIAIAVVLGHLFPIFFKFKGGKGVATGLGAILALFWPLGTALMVVWLVLAGIFRYSSLAAIGACGYAIVFSLTIDLFPYRWSIIILALLIITHHHKNILNLLNGREGKISFSKKANRKTKRGH